MMRIPDTLINNIINIHGEKGRQWLDDLPNLLQKFAKSWNLRLSDCYPHANINYVAPAKLESGLEVVLKCGVPSPVLVAEAKALQYYNGIGAVQLLQFAEESGVMLLERVMPGNLLEEYSDEDQATVQAVELLKKLHRPMTEISEFPYLNDWFQGLEKLTRYFEGHTGPFPSHLVEKAKDISRELLNSQGAQVLLHGDLHYANILWSEQNGWLAIDPQGVIGEREFDIPFPRLEKIIEGKLLQHRLDRQKIIPKDNLWLGDIRRLQIPSMFDAVICWFVLFHVHAHEHAPILKKFYDCLNPNGILLMTMADTASPQGDYQVVDDQSIKSMMFKEEFYYSGHSLSVNLKLIKAAGFQIIAEYCDQPGCHVILAQKVDIL
jgi:streptomycin 6-kinase